MAEWLETQGVHVKKARFIWHGSLKTCWSLYDPAQRWSLELADKLNGLGFRGFDDKPLHRYSGNGGMLAVFAKGHAEMIEGVTPGTR
jgi:hypothetical protein